jgi:hypothetical protein
MDFEAGQQWSYAASPDLAASRIIIGAILEFDGGTTIVCCAVRDALQSAADGSAERVVVPFLPMTREALAATVTTPDGMGELPADFADALESWRNDPRGASYFTVPFQGSLERMIALQMAALVGEAD